jgi:hypothetical protein
MNNYTVEVIRRDETKTYKNVTDFEVQENVILLYMENEKGFVTRKIIPLYNVLEVEIGR